MPTPSAVTSGHNVPIITTFDIDKPEKLNELFRIRGDQGLSYFAMLKSLGFVIPVAQGTYGHYEEDWIHETFHSNGTVLAPGPGNNIQITLQSSDLNTLNQFYPRLWDTVMFKNEVTGAIIDIDTTTPTAPVLTIRPNEATDDIGQVDAGEELIIISSSFTEGSGQPPSITRGVTFYDNDTQIIKEKFSVTGSEMTNQKWFVKWKNKKTGGTAYYLKGVEDTEYTMQLKIDGALLFQKRTTNTITDSSNPNVPNAQLKTTEGLIPYIRRNGNTIQHTPGLWSVQKFNQIVRILDREFAGNDICGFLGIGLSLENDETLKDYFDNTNIEYAMRRVTDSAFHGNNSLAASVDFNMLVKGGKTFLFKPMQVFSHSKLYGATGYDMPDMGVFLPLKKKRNKLTRENMPTFGMRHKKLDGYNRMMEIWPTGGAGPITKTDEFDVNNSNMRTEIGAHHMGGNQMILVDPT